MRGNDEEKYENEGQKKNDNIPIVNPMLRVLHQTQQMQHRRNPNKWLNRRFLFCLYLDVDALDWARWIADRSRGRCLGGIGGLVRIQDNEQCY